MSYKAYSFKMEEYDAYADIMSQFEDQEVKTNKYKIQDPFECFDNNELDHTCKLIKKNICPDCNIEMSIRRDEYSCDQCGYITEYDQQQLESQETINGYNTSDGSATPIKISGPHAYMFQKKLQGQTSNYQKTQKRNTIVQFEDTVYQYKGNHIPKYIVAEAADLYGKVQQHCIKRGDVRRGTMAACLYKICDLHNITRKPKEIAEIFGIPQYELSNGSKILDDLKARGLIKIKEDLVGIDETRMYSFLDNYFNNLNIPLDNEYDTPVNRPNYKRFACQLIRISDKYRIANSSIMSSKCAGVIYIIAMKRPELNIKKDMIEKKCAISKSTFNRFYNEINKVLNSDDEELSCAKQELERLYSLL